MKQRILFEGEIGDASIDECIQKLIEKARETGEDVFLHWNGATMRITSEDNCIEVLNGFNEQWHSRCLLAMERTGDILHVDALSEKIIRVIKELMKD